MQVIPAPIQKMLASSTDLASIARMGSASSPDDDDVPVVLDPDDAALAAIFGDPPPLQPIGTASEPADPLHTIIGKQRRYHAGTKAVITINMTVPDPAAPAAPSDPLAQARAYLHGQGWNAAAMAALRLGQPDAATIAALAPLRRTPAASGGFVLGTCDPRESTRWLGVVRVNYGQAKHAFYSPPAGLIIPCDLGDPATVVITDNPLLVGRLHSAGVAHVAGAEDVAVLPPLADWLRTRSVIVAAYRQPGLDALRSACRDLGVDARPVLVATELARMADDVRCILGAAPRVESETAESLSLATLRDLHDYAVRQVETTAGRAALHALGLDHADLITAYAPGFLPDGYRDLLPASQRSHFNRDWKGNAILLPCRDERGVIVDLVLVKADSNHVCRTLWDRPRGLLAPVLTTAFDHLTITDTPRRLRRLCRDGAVPLLLRGLADAHTNAARIAAAGVRAAEIHAHLDGDGIAAALAAAGIRAEVVRNPYGEHLRLLARSPRAVGVDGPATEDDPATEHDDATTGADIASPPSDMPPAPAEDSGNTSHADRRSLTADPPASAPEPVAAAPDSEPIVAAPAAPASAAPATALPTLVLLEHDRQTGRAVWRFGAGTYAIILPAHTTTACRITVTGPRGEASPTFDLAVPAARQRQVPFIGLNTGLAAAEIHAALVALVPALLALIDPTPAAVPPLNPATVPMRAEDRDAALRLAQAPDLLDQSVALLGDLGADASDPATTLAWLAAISRLADRPLWIAQTATLASEPFPALAAIAAATPPDQRIHITRLTAEALNHQAPDALTHKLVILGDLADTSERAATSLRLLRERGVIATTQVERTLATGGLRTRVVEVAGPIALLGGATRALPYGLQHHVLPVPLDDSPEARQRQVATEHALLADPAGRAAATARRSAAIQRLHHLQAVLAPRPVAIPDIATVAMPAALARARLPHGTLIGLITASALLHQHQRPTIAGCCVATGADTDIALRLMHHLAVLQASDLSRAAHRVLTTVWAAKLTSFTMVDLHRLLGWDRHAFRAALDELMRLDYVAAPRGVRGQFREYRLIASAPAADASDATAVRLRLPTPSTTAASTPSPEVAHG